MGEEVDVLMKCQELGPMMQQKLIGKRVWAKETKPKILGFTMSNKLKAYFKQSNGGPLFCQWGG